MLSDLGQMVFGFFSMQCCWFTIMRMGPDHVVFKCFICFFFLIPFMIRALQIRWACVPICKNHPCSHTLSGEVINSYPLLSLVSWIGQLITWSSDLWETRNTVRSKIRATKNITQSTKARPVLELEDALSGNWALSFLFCALNWLWACWWLEQKSVEFLQVHQKF